MHPFIQNMAAVAVVACLVSFSLPASAQPISMVEKRDEVSSLTNALVSRIDDPAVRSLVESRALRIHEGTSEKELDHYRSLELAALASPSKESAADRYRELWSALGRNRELPKNLPPKQRVALRCIAEGSVQNLYTKAFEAHSGGNSSLKASADMLQDLTALFPEASLPLLGADLRLRWYNGRYNDEQIPYVKAYIEYVEADNRDTRSNYGSHCHAVELAVRVAAQTDDIDYLVYADELLEKMLKFATVPEAEREEEVHRSRKQVSEMREALKASPEFRAQMASPYFVGSRKAGPAAP